MYLVSYLWIDGNDLLSKYPIEWTSLVGSSEFYTLKIFWNSFLKYEVCDEKTIWKLMPYDDNNIMKWIKSLMNHKIDHTRLLAQRLIDMLLGVCAIKYFSLILDIILLVSIFISEMQTLSCSLLLLISILIVSLEILIRKFLGLLITEWIVWYVRIACINQYLSTHTNTNLHHLV